MLEDYNKNNNNYNIKSIRWKNSIFSQNDISSLINSIKLPLKTIGATEIKKTSINDKHLKTILSDLKNDLQNNRSLGSTIDCVLNIKNDYKSLLGEIVNNVLNSSNISNNIESLHCDDRYALYNGNLPSKCYQYQYYPDQQPTMTNLTELCISTRKINFNRDRCPCLSMLINSNIVPNLEKLKLKLFNKNR